MPTDNVYTGESPEALSGGGWPSLSTVCIMTNEAAPSFVVFKGRGFRPRAPDFRIELARVSRQNHPTTRLGESQPLKTSKGWGSLTEAVRTEKDQRLGQPPTGGVHRNRIPR